MTVEYFGFFIKQNNINDPTPNSRLNVLLSPYNLAVRIYLINLIDSILCGQYTLSAL